MLGVWTRVHILPCEWRGAPAQHAGLQARDICVPDRLPCHVSDECHGDRGSPKLSHDTNCFTGGKNLVILLLQAAFAKEQNLIAAESWDEVQPLDALWPDSSAG